MENHRDADCEKIFRFPEEDRMEERLAALSPERLDAWLETVDCRKPEDRFERDLTWATECFSALDAALGRFLSGQGGKTDVFGRAQDPAAMYREFCILQGILQQAAERMGEQLAAMPQEAVPPDPRINWLLERITGCPDLPDECQQKASGILRLRERNRALAESMATRYEPLKTELRNFLRVTLAEYGERTLTPSDSAHGGRGLQAGQLQRLIAELREAVGGSLQRLSSLSGSRAGRSRA